MQSPQPIPISRILPQFPPISLEEMDGVKLMDRFDTKYIFSVHRLPALLQTAAGHYRILEIAGERDFNYSTTYLDTAACLFYTQQATGKALRHKVRFRVYENTGTSFLEVKRKTPRGKTLKYRIRHAWEDPLEIGKAAEFLHSYVPQEAGRLLPMLTNRFSRITLVNLESGERVTIDHDLSFHDGTSNSISLPWLAIAELKREGHGRHSWFAGYMRQCRIRPSGFSKYCIGSTLIRNMPKRGAFKPQVNHLNRIKYEFHNLARRQA